MDRTKTLINKFILGKRLSDEESVKIEKLLQNRSSDSQITQLLETKWEESKSENVSLRFEQIKQKIQKSSFKYPFNRFFIGISKVAAVLILPLLAAALYFYFNQNISNEFLTLTTQKGEQTSVILPDGSKVWLNVDTKLTYPVDFSIGSRNLNLEGEAYFEVEKNTELPFEVTSGRIKTTALGTRFSVSAYPSSDQIKSSLIEGSVAVSYLANENTTKTNILKPGRQLVFDKKNLTVTINSFNENFELGWKNDQLVFQLTPFNEVVTKLEQWYDVNIEYDYNLFKLETLTVRFEKYESLEKVLQVIGKTNGFNYSIEKNHVKLIKIERRN